MPMEAIPVIRNAIQIASADAVKDIRTRLMERDNLHAQHLADTQRLAINEAEQIIMGIGSDTQSSIDWRLRDVANTIQNPVGAARQIANILKPIIERYNRYSEIADSQRPKKGWLASILQRSNHVGAHAVANELVMGYIDNFLATLKKNAPEFSKKIRENIPIIVSPEIAR
jgi:hypothetical protein